MEVLLFTSSKCVHCPSAERLAKSVLPEYYDKGLVFRKVRVRTSEGKELANRFNVMGTPTFIFLDDEGRLLARLVGVPSKEKLRGEVEKGLGIKRSFLSRLFGA